MDNIGIDTIGFLKVFDENDYRRFIRPFITKGPNGLRRYRGALIFHHPIYQFGCSFVGSIVRFISQDNNNLMLGSPDDVREVIDNFQNAGLDIGDATISRLDAAMTIKTDKRVHDYYPLVQKKRWYAPYNEQNGRYLNSKEKSLVIYDKVIEMIAKGSVPDGFNTEQDLARIELRIKRHVKRHLKLPPGDFTMNHLANRYGYSACMRELSEHSIRLLKLHPLIEEISPTEIAAMAGLVRRLGGTDPAAIERALHEQKLGVELKESIRKRLKPPIEDPLKAHRIELYDKITRLCNEQMNNFPSIHGAQQ